MKSKEELNALKEEVKNVNEKLRELTDEELAQVSGGAAASAADSRDPFKVVEDPDNSIKL